MKYLLLILFFSLIVGCRFSKPFPSIRITKYVKDNSNEIVTNYKYFRISRYGILGHIHIEKKINPEGNLIEKSVHKYSAWVRDGFMKTHRKIITYSEKGIRKSVHLKISKGLGRKGEKLILDKTILFDENGKKIKPERSPKKILVFSKKRLRFY